MVTVRVPPETAVLTFGDQEKVKLGYWAHGAGVLVGVGGTGVLVGVGGTGVSVGVAVASVAASGLPSSCALNTELFAADAERLGKLSDGKPTPAASKTARAIPWMIFAQ
jgi:hypothetical protein